MSLDAMKQALAALENVYGKGKRCEAAILALRAAIKNQETQAEKLLKRMPVRGTLLEQTLGIVWDEMPHPDYQKGMEQKPVAWISESENLLSWDKFYDHMKPLYTSPRQWQGLTDEDREEILRWIEWKETGSQPIAPQKLIAYVERKLREKNT